jgi:hypothetical protein
MPKCKEAPNAEKMCDYVNPLNGLRCTREALAKGHCWTHYQQERRGKPLSPIRPRGLVLLPGNVRVMKPTAEVLKARVETGKARSVYEATRQAIEAGVAAWERQQAKAAKKEPAT